MVRPSRASERLQLVERHEPAGHLPVHPLLLQFHRRLGAGHPPFVVHELVAERHLPLHPIQLRGQDDHRLGAPVPVDGAAGLVGDVVERESDVFAAT